MIYKWFKKFKNVICFFLIVIFSVNIAGCGSGNGVKENKVHKKIGIGANTVGYTVYSQSTFDKMTQELLMGYLLSGRSFTLLVVPGQGDGTDENPYVLRDEDNVLYTASLAGIYEYDEGRSTFINPDKKLLLYYVTDVELRAWLNEFAKQDNFMTKVMEFYSDTVDVEDKSRFKCEQLVNMGTGLNAKQFCGTYSDEAGVYTDRSGVITNSDGDFDNAREGGMFLLFGYGSIEGYITYKHISDYRGSAVANTLVDRKDDFSVSSIYKFNYESMLYNNDGSLSAIGKELTTNPDYGYSVTNLADFINTSENKDQNLQMDLVSLYTETVINGSDPGYDMLKNTYKLIGSALLTDNNMSSINSLSSHASKQTEEREKWDVVLEVINMLYNFDDAALQEATDIKLSIALYSRYSYISEYPGIEDVFTGYNHNSKIGEKGDTISDYNRALELRNGIDSENGHLTDNSYLMVVTADGFTIDRGTQTQQTIIGAADFAGWNTILSELVRMDGCPNASGAQLMYSFVANLKIIRGAVLAAAGVTVAAVAGIGLVVASVISKLAVTTLVAPVPGGRIAALALVAITALVVAAVGVAMLIDGVADRSRLEAIGASEENYCKTYVSTFNRLFETLSLPLPVYHYEIPEDSSADTDLSINVCTGYLSVFIPSSGKCSDGNAPVSIPMYYYADKEKSKGLSLEGCPMLMYFKNGKLVDYISGASTPEFIVEMLRLWGLLSMREVVYNAQVQSDNYQNLNIYHTSNTTARTHTIYSAKHCITLDYGKDLSQLREGDFCYSTSGTAGAIETSFGQGKEYISYNADQRAQTILTVNTPNSTSGINKTLENMSTYSLYYAATSGYKFNSYKDQVKIDMNDSGSTIGYEFAFPNVTEIYLKTKEGDKDIFLDIYGNRYDSKEKAPVYKINYIPGTNYILIDGMILKASKITDVIGGDLTIIAKFNGTAEDFKNNFESYKIVKESTDKGVVYYTIADFIAYLQNELNFEMRETIIPLYYTVTVKEAPQTNTNGNKTCKEGQYLYFRDNVAVWDNAAKCLADDKVKSKDRPYATTKFDQSPAAYRYYTTSIKVGNIVLTLNEDGVFEKKITWLYG